MANGISMAIPTNIVNWKISLWAADPQDQAHQPPWIPHARPQGRSRPWSSQCRPYRWWTEGERRCEHCKEAPWDQTKLFHWWWHWWPKLKKPTTTDLIFSSWQKMVKLTPESPRSRQWGQQASAPSVGRSCRIPCGYSNNINNNKNNMNTLPSEEVRSKEHAQHVDRWVDGPQPFTEFIKAFEF